MRKIREALRLHHGCGLGIRQTAQSLGAAHSTVGEILRRAEAASLSWPLPDDLDDSQLEARLFPVNRPRQRSEPDWDEVHIELRRKGVTLQLLWLEYKQAYPDGYEYSRFCELYRAWRQKVEVVMRQQYRAGEKVLVDFAGQTVPVVDPRTGETKDAHFFIAVLGASNYVYAEAFWSQDLHSWITGHTRALEFFGGVPEIVVPDQTRTAVKTPCHYEPDLNPTYRDWAEHYGTVVIPARPGKARDKAKVESAVLLAERWLLAPMRNHTFFSLAELNGAVRDNLDVLNNRPLQNLEGTRRLLYERLDKPALKPLPNTRYEYAEWLKARVNIDYHIQIGNNYYSVPFQLAREQVDVRLTSTTVEVLHKGRRVASHVRSNSTGRYTTCAEHMPAAHRAHLEWSPGRLVRWAGSVGPGTAEFVKRVLEIRRHPEQGYRSCLGLMCLARRYEPERLEAACSRASHLQSYTYRSVKSILEKGLDRLPIEKPEAPFVKAHANLRGPDYYASRKETNRCFTIRLWRGCGK